MSRLLPYDIRYENSAGEQLCLSQVPYMLTGGQLFDARWKLTAVSRPLGEGQQLVGARRSCEERSITVKIAANSAGELSALLRQMNSIFDRDVAALQPGRLWVNGRYMTCWCSARQNELSCDFVSAATVVISILPESPVWCSETAVTLSRGDEGAQSAVSGKRYPYSYSYRYSGGRQGAALAGSGRGESPMRITFFGPARNPSVYINGQQIGVSVTLGVGERAVIDQRSRTVTLLRQDGKSENIFDSRIKNGLTFAPLPAGGGAAIAESDGEVEIVIIDQRSEPEWALS